MLLLTMGAQCPLAYITNVEPNQTSIVSIKDETAWIVMISQRNHRESNVDAAY